MELPDWLVDLIIVLVVILVIGSLVYIFYPEAFSRVGEIAGEVFGVTGEKKKAEATEEFITNVLESITTCLESGLNDCYCSLKREALPEGYKILLKNTAPGLLISGFTDEDVQIGGKLVNGIKVSLAQVANYEENKEIQSDIVCKPTDILLVNDEGNIVVRQVWDAKFYTDKGLSIPEILKLENNLCFVTDAIEAKPSQLAPTGKETEALIKSGDVKFLTKGKKISSLNEVLWLLESLAKCENTVSRHYSLTWPVSQNDIMFIRSCFNLYEDATGIGINVVDGASVKVPVYAAVITDYCEKNCGEEPYITMHEVYNAETNWPTGRYIKISGISIVKEGLRKGEVTDTKIRGTALTAGSVIATASPAINFVIGYSAMPGNKLTIQPPGLKFKPDKELIKEMFCQLPHLKLEAYSGADCSDIAKLIEARCREQRPTSNPAISLYELARAISRLKDGEKGSMLFDIGEDDIIIGFEKNEVTFGEEPSWYKRFSSKWSIEKPEQCGNKACICLCQGWGALAGQGTLKDACKEASCQTFDEHGFQPVSMQGGKDSELGPYIEADGLLLRQAYYERKGNTLGLCTEPPCIAG